MTARPGATRWPSILPRPGTSSSRTSILAGTIALVWQDNRTDDDYDVQLAARQYVRRRGPAGVVGHRRGQRLAAYSTTARRTPPRRASVVREPPALLRDVWQPRRPFQGDYNWISLAERGDGHCWATCRGPTTATWSKATTCATTAEGGYDDNFDVLQCRTDLGAQRGRRPRRRPARPS